MKAYYTLPAIYKEPAVYVPCNREIFLLTIDCGDVFLNTSVLFTYVKISWVEVIEIQLITVIKTHTQVNDPYFLFSTLHRNSFTF